MGATAEPDQHQPVAVAGHPPVPASAAVSPFALPAETDLRFVLLVAAVLATALLLDHVAYSAVHDPAYQQAVSACRSRDADPLAVAACLAPEDRLTAVWMLFGLACVAGAGVVVYLWVLPSWWLRGNDIKPYGTTDPSLAEAIGEYSDAVGISRPRLFLRQSRVPSAVALAVRRRPALVLNLGLLLQFRLDPPSFRAVVLHELAHIRNGDVGRTFVALALVVALGLVAGVPYLMALGVSLLGPPTPDHDPLYILGVVWRAVVMPLIVLVTLAAVLRARELFADARCAAWQGDPSALARVLSRLKDGPTGSGWLAMHPAPAERRAALEEPRRLFATHRTDAFAVGVIAAAIGPELSVLLGLLLAGSAVQSWRDVMAGLTVGGLVAGIVGLAMARALLPELVEDGPRRASPALTLPLGGGLIVGQTVALSGALDISGLALLQPAELAFAVAFAAVLLVSLRVLLAWMAASIRAWLVVALGRPSAALPLGVCLGTWAIVLGVWFGVLLTAHDFGSLVLLADLRGTGGVQPGVWLLAVAPLVASVPAALGVALLARACLRAARRAVPSRAHSGAWLQPDAPLALGRAGP